MPEVEMNQEPPAADSSARWRKLLPYGATIEEVLEFLLFSVFFLVYGLTPFLGGDGLGLVGADEPRYAEGSRALQSCTPKSWKRNIARQ